MTRVSAVSLVLLTLVTSSASAQVTYPVDFRIGVQSSSARLSQSLDDVLGTRESFSLRSFDISLAAAAGEAGIGGRLAEGKPGVGQFKHREARIFLGQHWFRVEAAYGDRSVYSGDSTALYSRAGIRSTVPIGGTGLSLGVAGSKYFRGNFTGDSAKVDPSGWEGETNIYYTVKQIPVFAQLGYRVEHFTYRESADYIRGIVFGGGLWLGGR
jgi:hypothetical protein